MSLAWLSKLYGRWTKRKGDDVEPTTFQNAFDEVAADLRKLMVGKQRDYGHDNITAFGEMGVLVRANDKMCRLRNLLTTGEEPNFEAIEDSWMDMANYAIIALMLRRGTFTLPLEDEVW